MDENELKQELVDIRHLYHYLLTVYQKEDVYKVDGLVRDLTSVQERLNKVVKELQNYEGWVNYDK